MDKDLSAVPVIHVKGCVAPSIYHCSTSRGRGVETGGSSEFTDHPVKRCRVSEGPTQHIRWRRHLGADPLASTDTCVSVCSLTPECTHRKSWKSWAWGSVVKGTGCPSQHPQRSLQPFVTAIPEGSCPLLATIGTASMQYIYAKHTYT